MAVPYTFGSATTSIPLSQLDSNFATTITLGNTAIQLGNTVTTLNNMTFANATVSSGNVTVLNATVTNDASISGLTVGKGTGAVSNNTSVGSAALAGSNSGTGRNTAVGYSALQFNTTGYVNTAIGSFALQNITTGYENTAVGDYALRLTTGNSNTGIGQVALANNTSGSSNTAVGGGALVSNTTASYNTAVGYQAMYNGTTADRSTAFGNFALYSVTTATGNQAFGERAGNSITTGATNLAVGQVSLFSTTTGNYNTAIGNSALYSNTIGIENTAVGYQALNANTTASYNTSVGRNSLYLTTTGTHNTCIGHNSGYNISTGIKNTILGRYDGNQYGLDIRTASNYIVLSDGDGNPRQVIDSSGNVGIGTTSPLSSAMLEVSRSTTVLPTATVTADNQVTGWRTRRTGGTYPYEYYMGIRENSTALDFYDNTANALRMRIDSSGNLLVGNTTTTATPAQGVNLGMGGGSAGVYIGHANGTSSGNYYMAFSYNGSAIGSITQNGTTGVLYNLTSDYRLKNNPIALTGAKDFVMALQPKTWDWWDGSGKGVGFIAHEFMEVAKYSGHGEKDAVDENGNPIHQSIQPSSSEVMANIVALLQEQQALITAQAETINALTARVVALETK